MKLNVKGKKLALIKGGASMEREISYRTVHAVSQALDELACSYYKVEADSDIFTSLKKEKPDLAFLGTHGVYGEDGCLQSICEFLKIPYTGSGVLSSAICMDKIFFKNILRTNKIRTPDFVVVDKHFKKEQVKYPVVVKASHGGSSLGTYVVEDASQLAPAIEKARQIGQQVFLETYLPQAREVAVSYLGDELLPSVEILPKASFYDYTSKYESEETRYKTPASLPAETKKELESTCRKVISLVKMRGYGRLDFLIDQDNTPWLLEANTLPGLTNSSLLPMSAEQAGISFPQLIDRICSYATTDYMY